MFAKLFGKKKCDYCLIKLDKKYKFDDPKYNLCNDCFINHKCKFCNITFPQNYPDIKICEQCDEDRRCNVCNTLFEHPMDKLNHSCIFNAFDHLIRKFLIIPRNDEAMIKKKKKIILPKEDDMTAYSDDDDICKICCHNIINTVNLPCGHMFFCTCCANKYDAYKKKKCPTCDTTMTEIKKIFK
jgi:hypothetical protein